MTTPYPNSLPSDIWEGLVGNITIRWKDAAKGYLCQEASAQGVDRTTMKALTEHFLYEVAVQRGNTAVAVR